MSSPVLTPRLVVADGSAAIEFYVAAFGATVEERFAAPDGVIVHAALAIDGAVFSVVDRSPEHGNVDPTELGGSAVILTLNCTDPDAVAQRAEGLGAEVVIPVDDRFYGYREGRIRDPFGHLWILSKMLTKLAPDDIQRQVDAMGPAKN